MKEWNVDVDLGMSGFNIHVKAENFLGAMVSALAELDNRKITENNIESLNIIPI